MNHEEISTTEDLCVIDQPALRIFRKIPLPFEFASSRSFPVDILESNERVRKRGYYESCTSKWYKSIICCSVTYPKSAELLMFFSSYGSESIKIALNYLSEEFNRKSYV